MRADRGSPGDPTLHTDIQKDGGEAAKTLPPAPCPGWLLSPAVISGDLTLASPLLDLAGHPSPLKTLQDK